jgi:hypothetical protein
MRNISIDELDRAIFILRLQVSEQKKIIAETDAGPFASAARLKLENLCDNVTKSYFAEIWTEHQPSGGT